MPKITFTGTGQLNGVVIIDKTIEVDYNQLGGFTGQHSYEVIKATLQIYYPGVEIVPWQIGVHIHD